MKYTEYGFRINQVSEGSGYNWLFFPGGPGLGSEYLSEFCKNLNLPGNTFLIDFPMDGTNKKGKLDINDWKEGLLDLVKSYANPIIVTHSFSGMFVLNIPEIENHLAGLVLMNTTTTNSFFQHTSEARQINSLPDLLPPASAYHLNPSNKTYREFWDTYKYYCFTPEEILIGEKMLPLFAFNNDAYHYIIQNFYINYEAKWYPTLIPAMTIASENDFICPPQIFSLDRKYQSKNVSNVIINKAGHCPWIMQFEQLKKYFNKFIETL
jgi:pimeloyl-ACP methyl ester carboxylesterase